jgi:hypothetical protein
MNNRVLANGHKGAALPSPRILELCIIQGLLQWRMLAEKPALVDGWNRPRPGLGVALAANLEEHFPYVEGDYRVPVTR